MPIARIITEEDKKRMVYLRYTEKLKLKQIGEIIGCDPHTVRYWLGARKVMLEYDHEYYKENIPWQKIPQLKAEIAHNKRRINKLEKELDKLLKSKRAFKQSQGKRVIQ
jgi:transposase-like protein